MRTILQAKKFIKYLEQKNKYIALADINLDIQEGKSVGIMGPSGSGELTLLNVLSTIDP